jgi:hypothetical protein
LSHEKRPTVEVDLRIELRHALTPLGQVQRILEHLRAAEALAAGMADRLRLGRIVSFTANCLVTQARYSEALTAGTRALAIARELQDRPIEVATGIYMARARLSRGECREAIETIRALNEVPADDFSAFQCCRRLPRAAYWQPVSPKPATSGGLRRRRPKPPTAPPLPGSRIRSCEATGVAGS